MITSYQTIAKKLFLFGCLIGLIGIIISAHKYIQLKRSIIPYLTAYSAPILQNASKLINAEFEALQNVTQKIADALNNGALPTSEFESELKLIAEKHPSLFQIGIAFKPDITTAKTKLEAPAYTNLHSKTIFDPITYGYSQEKWFLAGLKKAQWLDPYIENTNNALVVERVVPFYAPTDIHKTTAIGVVFASYNLKTVRKFLSSLDLGKTGYATIISNKGTFISHPLDALVKSQKPIAQLVQEYPNESLKELYAQVTSHTDAMLEFDDPVTGQKSWLAYTTLPSTGWHILLAIVKNEVLAEQSDTLRHHLIWLLLSIIAFIASLLFFFGAIHAHSSKYLWCYSALISFIFCTGIGYLWYLQLHVHTINPEGSTIITDRTSLHRYLDQFEKNNKRDSDTVQVPTGIYIRSIDFDDTPKVGLLGYMWQKYPLGTNQLATGFVIPEATAFEKVPIYEKETKNGELFSWDFYAKLYQDLDYKTFPFDYKHIALQIKPKEIRQSITLIPDEDGYNFINPHSKPGIASKLKISGWEIEQAYFSFDNPYNSHHEKIAHYVGEKNSPQLHYNIIIRRDFLDPFIAYIIPLLVALFFLFMTIVLTSQSVIWDPITLVSAIFFSVIVAHLNLRTKFTGQPVFYLEYFYIITYLMMFATVIVIFLVTKKYDHPLIVYKQAIIPKVLYWPVLFFMCLAITAYIFY